MGEHLDQPERHGQGIGDLCCRDGCCGRLDFHPVANCSCHVNPPCLYCEQGLGLHCPDCGWEKIYD